MSLPTESLKVLNAHLGYVVLVLTKEKKPKL